MELWKKESEAELESIIQPLEANLYRVSISVMPREGHQIILLNLTVFKRSHDPPDRHTL